MINSLLNAFIHFSERFHEKIYFCHAFRPKAPLCDVKKVDEKKTATSAEMLRKVKKRLDRNPHHSCRKMARELNISQYAIRQILKNELEVTPLKIQKVQDLTETEKKSQRVATVGRK